MLHTAVYIQIDVARKAVERLHRRLTFNFIHTHIKGSIGKYRHITFIWMLYGNKHFMQFSQRDTKVKATKKSTTRKYCSIVFT